MSFQPSAPGWTPDFHWLTDRLAVGGCFPPARSPELARHHGIRAIIDVRHEGRDDERLLAESNIALLHLPAPDLLAPSPAQLDQGVAFAHTYLGRGEAVLIHCQHGIGRSALLALCVLVDLGMAPIDALRLAKEKRAKVSPSEAQYRAWAEWLRRRGEVAPTYHEFGCIAYRQTEVR